MPRTLACRPRPGGGVAPQTSHGKNDPAQGSSSHRGASSSHQVRGARPWPLQDPPLQDPRAHLRPRSTDRPLFLPGMAKFEHLEAAKVVIKQRLRIFVPQKRDGGGVDWCPALTRDSSRSRPYQFSTLKLARPTTLGGRDSAGGSTSSASSRRSRANASRQSLSIATSGRARG